MRNTFAAPDADCHSVTDMGRLIDADKNPEDSASISDSGSSGQSYSTNESMAQEGNSFMSPTNRRPSKPFPEKKSQTQLLNHFNCLEEVNSMENSYENLRLSD